METRRRRVLWFIRLILALLGLRTMRPRRRASLLVLALEPLTERVAGRLRPTRRPWPQPEQTGEYNAVLALTLVRLGLSILALARPAWAGGARRAVALTSGTTVAVISFMRLWRLIRGRRGS